MSRLIALSETWQYITLQPFVSQESHRKQQRQQQQQQQQNQLFRQKEREIMVCTVETAVAISKSF